MQDDGIARRGAGGSDNDAVLGKLEQEAHRKRPIPTIGDPDGPVVEPLTREEIDEMVLG